MSCQDSEILIYLINQIPISKRPLHHPARSAVKKEVNRTLELIA